MNTYIYKAEVYCVVCAAYVKDELRHAGKQPADDSDVWPQGPYSASEADTPQHCASCPVFLENPLTCDGYAYVAEKLNELNGEDFGDNEVLLEWASFYDFDYDPSTGWTVPRYN